MNDSEIKAALVAALPMRPPRFEANTPPRLKIDALEEYLLHSAWMHAELEEALHWCDALVMQFTGQIERMDGYEVALPRKPRDRLSQADITAAKRTVNPAVFELGAEMKQVRTSLVRQIDRFAFEKEVVSRAYSLISGG